MSLAKLDLQALPQLKSYWICNWFLKKDESSKVRCARNRNVHRVENTSIQMMFSTRNWFYHQDIQESKLSEKMRFLRSTIIIIVYHVLQTLTSLVKRATHLFCIICRDLSHADQSCFAKMFICYTFNQIA